MCYIKLYTFDIQMVIWHSAMGDSHTWWVPLSRGSQQRPLQTVEGRISHGKTRRLQRQTVSSRRDRDHLLSPELQEEENNSEVITKLARLE